MIFVASASDTLLEKLDVLDQEHPFSDQQCLKSKSKARMIFVTTTFDAP